MSTMFWALALGTQLVFFGAIARESVRHFVQDPAPGHRLIQVSSPLATVGLVLMSWWVGPQALILSTIALVLSGAGFVLFRVAISTSTPGCLGVAFGPQASERLLQTGVYGVVRNPLYTSYLIYWSAWAVLTGFAWPAFAVTAFFGAVYWIAARREEVDLSDSFGADYAAYRMRTGRFLPRLWRNSDV